MGQAYAIPGITTKCSPSAPALTPIIENSNKQLYLAQSSSARIEVLVRLVITSQNPFIQCRGEEIAICAHQMVPYSSKQSGSYNYHRKHSMCTFQILFDRCCAVSAILGESIDELIPDVLDFAYDYKNFPLVFDGAFTLKFGKMAQVRPRTVELEHGMEFTVVFHMKDPKEIGNNNGRMANMENMRDG